MTNIFAVTDQNVLIPLIATISSEHETFKTITTQIDKEPEDAYSETHEDIHHELYFKKFNIDNGKPLDCRNNMFLKKEDAIEYINKNIQEDIEKKLKEIQILKSKLL